MNWNFCFLIYSIGYQTSEFVSKIHFMEISITKIERDREREPKKKKYNCKLFSNALFDCSLHRPTLRFVV